MSNVAELLADPWYHKASSQDKSQWMSAALARDKNQAEQIAHDAMGETNQRLERIEILLQQLVEALKPRDGG